MGRAFSAVLATLDVVEVTLQSVGIRRVCSHPAKVSIYAFSFGGPVREPISEHIQLIA
jgi:hypothetical protein